MLAPTRDGINEGLGSAGGGAIGGAVVAASDPASVKASKDAVRTDDEAFTLLVTYELLRSA